MDRADAIEDEVAQQEKQQQQQQSEQLQGDKEYVFKIETKPSLLFKQFFTFYLFTIASLIIVRTNTTTLFIIYLAK